MLLKGHTKNLTLNYICQTNFLAVTKAQNTTVIFYNKKSRLVLYGTPITYRIFAVKSSSP